MGVHTGDSVCVAPQQTLTDPLYQKLRDQAIAVIRAVGVETGGSNVQFAVNPATEEIVVIEMNPRVSRSSRAGVQGHRVPDRQDRRAAGRRLRARRDPQRHHAPHAGELRAGARLLRRQVAALRLREVPGRRRPPHHAHEVRRRGDGDRPHLPAGVRQGACAAASSIAARRPAWPTDELLEALENARRGSLRPDPRAASPRGRRPRRSGSAPASIPGSCASSRAARHRRRRVRGDAHVQGRRHLRRGVRGRDALLLLGLGAPRRPRTRSTAATSRAS